MQVVLISFYIAACTAFTNVAFKSVNSVFVGTLNLTDASYSDAVLLGVHWSIVVYPFIAGLFYWAARFWQQQPLRFG